MGVGKTAVYAFTRKGARLAGKISETLGGDLYLPERLAGEFDAKPFSALGPLVRSLFLDYGSHVFVGATGIAVRAVAPIIRSKDRDPAVVVVDQQGRYAVSLLAGHLGGANELARRIAGITGGEAVITTATDGEGIPSIDMLAMEKGMAIGNIEAVKEVNGALLDGGPIQVFDPEDRMGLSTGMEGVEIISVVREQEWLPDVPGVWVSWREKEPGPGQLVLHPRCLVVGLGCNRGTTVREICRTIEDLFASQGLSLSSLLALSTIDLKRDERGLIQAAAALETSIRFFQAESLDKVEVPNPSVMAKRHVGARSVCEAAAIKGAWNGRLVVPKIKSGSVTLAVALAP